MEQVFVNLEKIHKLIQKKPQEFQEIDSNVIFGLLETNDYETVINRIRKNLVPSEDPVNLTGSIIVPDSPVNGQRVERSDISHTEDTNGGLPKDGRSKNNRKRKRSESDLLPSPGRPKNGEATMDEVPGPLNAEDQTKKDEMLGHLLEIFPDQKPVYLKNVINSNAGLQVDQLVAILLDQNMDVNDIVNNDHHIGEKRRNLHVASNNSLVHEVVVVSDDDDMPQTVMDISSSTPKITHKKLSIESSTESEHSKILNGNSSFHDIVNRISPPPVNGSSSQPVNGSSSQTINQIAVITNTKSLVIAAEHVTRLSEQDLSNVATPPEHNDVANVTIDLGAGPGEADAGHDDGQNAPVNGEHHLVHDLQDINEPAAGPSNNENTSEKDSTLSTLLNYFPHVDPSYLQKTANDIGNCQTKLQHFIENNVGSTNLPNRKEYDAKMAKKSAIDKVKNMTVSDFLKEFENPEQSFNDIASTVSESYKKSCTEYINAKFGYLTVKARTKILKENNHHLLPCVKKLKNIKSSNKRKAAEAKDTKVPMESLDLSFFKDYIYMKLEPRIQEAIRQNEDMRKQRIDEARTNGALFECQCCYDEECLLIEVCMCAEGHMFCRECVRRGAEVQIGDNKIRINCLQDCQAEIELRELEKVLRPTIYTRLVERQANEDLMNANVENLVQCPACNFAVIIPESEKLIRCESSDCGKVSCKECKEENHLPLRCDEVEKDDEVKARTKLENAMAEAMIRECPKCKNRFVKSDGCNKMQCNKCKTIMCYLCKQVISNDYKHFYGHGATPKKQMCPLWSDNDTLHKSEVAKAADETKKELGDNAATLKHDPTAGMERPPEGFDKKKNRAHALAGGAGLVRHQVNIPRFPMPGIGGGFVQHFNVPHHHMMHHHQFIHHHPQQQQQMMQQQQQMLQHGGVGHVLQHPVAHQQYIHQGIMPAHQPPRPPVAPMVPGLDGRAAGGFNRIMQNIGMGEHRVMDYLRQGDDNFLNNHYDEFDDEWDGDGGDQDQVEVEFEEDWESDEEEGGGGGDNFEEDWDSNGEEEADNEIAGDFVGNYEEVGNGVDGNELEEDWDSEDNEQEDDVDSNHELEEEIDQLGNEFGDEWNGHEGIDVNDEDEIDEVIGNEFEDDWFGHHGSDQGTDNEDENANGHFGDDWDLNNDDHIDSDDDDSNSTILNNDGSHDDPDDNDTNSSESDDQNGVIDQVLEMIGSDDDNNSDLDDLDSHSDDDYSENDHDRNDYDNDDHNENDDGGYDADDINDSSDDMFEDDDNNTSIDDDQNHNNDSSDDEY